MLSKNTARETIDASLLFDFRGTLLLLLHIFDSVFSPPTTV